MMFHLLQQTQMSVHCVSDSVVDGAIVTLATVNSFLKKGTQHVTLAAYVRDEMCHQAANATKRTVDSETGQKL